MNVLHEKYASRSLQEIFLEGYDRKEFGIPTVLGRQWQAAGVITVGDLCELVLRSEQNYPIPKGIGPKSIARARRLCEDLGVLSRVARRGSRSLYYAIANEARDDERGKAESAQSAFGEWKNGLRAVLRERMKRRIMFVSTYATVTWLKDALMASLANDAQAAPGFSQVEFLFGPRCVFEGASIVFDAELQLTQHDLCLTSAKSSLTFRNDVLARVLKQWQASGTANQKTYCSVAVLWNVIKQVEVSFVFHPTKPLSGTITVEPTEDEVNKLIEAAKPERLKTWSAAST